MVSLTGLVAIGDPASAQPYVLGGGSLLSKPDSSAHATGASGLGDTIDLDDGANSIVFVSADKNLAGAGDTNNKNDVYWKHFATGDVELVSVGVAGVQPDQPSSNPSMSDDARYVAFVNSASNLGFPGDTNGGPDVFVRDRQTDTTTRVSVGQTAAGGGSQPSVSGTGRYVAFVDGGNVYRRDLTTSTTIEVSLGTGGASANGPCDHPSISDDGVRVAFTCAASATNVVANDTNGSSDVFLRDVDIAGTIRVSLAAGGAQLPTGGSGGIISGDGEVIGFVSASPAISGGAALGTELYLRQVASATTVLGSPANNTVKQGGGAASIVSSFELSDDGSTTAFTASGGGRSPFPTTAATDVYVSRLGAGGCTFVASSAATTENKGGNGASRTPALSAGTSAVAFASKASDVVDGDVNGVEDIISNDTYCPPDQPFSDVPYAHPFFIEIDWMVGAHIATGYADGTFKPTAPVTRQALASFLWKMSGSPAPTGPAPSFSDVPVGHPFRTAIWWMVGQGLTDGYPDGGFHPGTAVSRQALASFLWKLSGSPVVSPYAWFITDVPADHPFYNAIFWTVKNQVATGYPDETFRPTAPVSRQAAAAFLTRFHNLGGPKK